MVFKPYIYAKGNHEKVDVIIDTVSVKDLMQTADLGWQTKWNNEYLSAPDIHKVSVKTELGELVALGAYRVIKNQAYVYVLYLESAPESNPTIQRPGERKYSGIGKLLFAYGIKYSIDKGCGGIVVFEAKTEDLANYYVVQYGAIEIPKATQGGPRRFMLADRAAWLVFSEYLTEEIDHG